MLAEFGEDGLLDAVFEAVPMGLCLLDGQGTVVRANRAWLGSMQLTSDEAIGQPYTQLAPERAAQVLALRAGEPGKSLTLPARANPGGGAWEERLTCVPLAGTTGLLISARESAASALNAAVEALPIGVVIVEAAPGCAPTLVAQNAAHASMLGLRLDASGSPRHELFRSDRSTPLEISDWPGPRAALSGEAVREVAVHVRRPDGEWRVLEASAVPVTRTGDAAGRAVVVTIDVTERFRAEQALRQSEATYRAAFEQQRQLVEHTPAAIALLDRDLRYLAVSQRFALDYRVDPQALLGRSHYEVFPEIPERWREVHRRCLAGAVERCDEEAFPRQDGRVDWVQWEIRPWRDAAGEIGGIVLFSVLVNERKLAADKLLASKERLAVTLASIGDAVIATNEAAEITLLNGVAEQLTGWSADEAMGRPLTEIFRIVSEETGESVSSPAERALSEGVVVGLANHTLLIARDGSQRPIADSAAPIRHAHGGVSGVVLVFRDQTEERRSELALERSRAELLALVEKLPIGLFVTDGPEIVYANPTFASYVGRASAAELLGRRPQELAYESASGPPEPGKEWTVAGPEGGATTLECSSAREIEFAGRPAQLWACRDLSQLKIMQAQLLHSDRLATVGMLAAGVAHEINNPLAYVIGALDFIEERLGRSRESWLKADLDEAFDSLRDAREGALRVKTIVRDLKAFSRADQDERVTLDLVHVLDSAVSMAGNEIKHRARLVRDYAAAPSVIGNEARLGQVFLNLLVNAAHAIPEGRADQHEIRVVLRRDARGFAVIEVRDTGAGIPANIIGRIFDPFFTTKLGVGTGLGLAISRNTVVALGGDITLESQPGSGTVARVVLPPGALPAEAQPRPSIEPPGQRAARVLVVDDESSICRMLRRMLEGHEVTTETSAQDAWARIEGGERYDVIFCDVMMPGMTGMEFHDGLRDKVPDQAERLVFITGGIFSRSAEEFLTRVSNQRIEKPFDPKEIRTIVSRATQ